MELCYHAKTPLYMTDEVIRIFEEEIHRGLDLQSNSFKSRSAVMNELSKRYPVPQPSSIPVRLEGYKDQGHSLHHTRGLRSTHNVITYDFVQVTNDFYLDPSIRSNISNFMGYINPADPYKPKPPTADGSVDEIVDGQW